MRIHFSLLLAIAVFLQVAELHSADISAAMQLGYGSPQEMMLELEGWKKDLETILKNNPGNVDASFQLGLVELRLGQFSEAAKKFKTIVKNHPRHSEAHYYLGVVYLRQGDYASAIPALKEAINLRPKNLEAKWDLKVADDEEGGYPGGLEEEYKIEIFQEEISKPSVKFIDVAAKVGVAKVDGGRGSAWGDYDNDGDLDIFAAGNYAPHALFRNNGDGTFTDVAAQAGVDDPRGGWASLFADYDNDGALDIYVTREGWFGRNPNTLYHNNGDGTFTDVTKEAGVGDTGSSFCAAFGDYDNDGYLDIYIADGVTGDGSPNVLYHNNGDGTFTDVASKAGVAHKGRSIGVAFGDYDNDGYLDIHVVNLGQPNVLYHNNGDGTFTDVTKKAGVLLSIKNAYVTFFFDYDNDGRLDIFVSNMSSFRDVIESKIEGIAYGGSSALYHNNGDGTFTDVTIEAGLSKSFGSMGANFGDIDNDGYQDIYLANGGPEMGRLEPDTLFHNNGDGTFSDITDFAGIGNIGKGHGVTFGDYDGDGDLDIYVPAGGAFVGDQWPNLLYRNEGNKNNWLVIKTIGTKSNRDGVGAKVTVTSGSLSLYAEVSGGCGFGSTNSLPLEFGLGDYTQADSIEIKWPSGLLQKLKNVAANQTITVVEGTSTDF